MELLQSFSVEAIMYPDAAWAFQQLEKNPTEFSSDVLLQFLRAECTEKVRGFYKRALGHFMRPIDIPRISAFLEVASEPEIDFAERWHHSDASQTAYREARMVAHSLMWADNAKRFVAEVTPLKDLAEDYIEGMKPRSVPFPQLHANKLTFTTIHYGNWVRNDTCHGRYLWSIEGLNELPDDHFAVIYALLDHVCNGASLSL